MCACAPQRRDIWPRTWRSWMSIYMWAPRTHRARIVPIPNSYKWYSYQCDDSIHIARGWIKLNMPPNRAREPPRRRWGDLTTAPPPPQQPPNRQDGIFIVRRAGLMRSHEYLEMWWSVPFTCAWLYMSFLLFCLIFIYSSQDSFLFWIMYLL